MPIIEKISSRLNFYIKKFFYLYIKRDPFTREVQRWYQEGGEEFLRYDYKLTQESLVFDLGGYRGEWSQKIADKYNPQIYIFEVVPEHFISIRERFKNNPKVSVFNFGLSDKNKELGVRVENEKSSIHKSGGRQVSVSLVDVEEFFNREGIDHVDLMKINIEGGEYDLLKGMIRSDLIRACNDLQIQFHDFFENAKSMRREIRKELEHTHYLTFDYSFVWENWRRRE